MRRLSSGGLYPAVLLSAGGLLAAALVLAGGAVLIDSAPGATPARPAQCRVLVPQITAYARAIAAEEKTPFTVAQMDTTSQFELTLQREAASPAVPQPLWEAEENLAGALQDESAGGVTAAVSQVKAICG